jgi:hypothetical protein
MVARDRKYPTTGYWLFVCNTGNWRADEFLATGETDLHYSISKHHRADIRPGQLGMLRLNERRRSGSRRAMTKGIYAVLEVIGRPEFMPDSDQRHYVERERAIERRWRVHARVVANLLDRPILATALPDESEFKHVRVPLQTATIPLQPRAFEYLIKLAGVSAGGIGPRLDDLIALELNYADATPELREFISRRVERGPIGERVKAKRGYRCQLCEVLGREPIAFQTSSGRSYAEAHHVIPVSRMERGSLSILNVMVLCPNHHRQVHHGDFVVQTDAEDHWIVKLDGARHKVEKTLI